jgi:hypothetical protein
MSVNIDGIMHQLITFKTAGNGRGYGKIIGAVMDQRGFDVLVLTSGKYENKNHDVIEPVPYYNIIFERSNIECSGF